MKDTQTHNADLISRSALLKNAYVSEMWNRETQKFDLKVVDVDDVIAAPTVDTVEVVRCRGCKWFMWFTEKFAKKSGFDGTCNLLVGYTDCGREMRKRMDYCSYGEPWEDAEVEG